MTKCITVYQCKKLMRAVRKKSVVTLFLNLFIVFSTCISSLGWILALLLVDSECNMLYSPNDQMA